MARAIEDLLAGRDRRQTLAESGFRAWRKAFTWEDIAAQYERLYLNVVH